MLTHSTLLRREELDALLHAARCGVTLLATAHAADCAELRERFPSLRELFPCLAKVDRSAVRLEWWTC